MSLGCESGLLVPATAGTTESKGQECFAFAGSDLVTLNLFSVPGTKKARLS